VGSLKPSPKDEADPELERARKLLRQLVERSLFTKVEVAERCGWSNSRLSRLIGGPTALRIRDLLAVLGAIHVQPGDYFYRLYG
jgi:hypothetical protein